MKSPAARVIAFYLPQFHPIPENDVWWGTGFTEWTNVAKAKPMFRGHKQPRLPADLGFYDLRVPETREKQAELARNAGVEAFCYWHYWWGHGKRIIERPFEEVRDSGKPDFPFCLAWANQSWTGIWHGNPGSVLMKQEYPGHADEELHFRWAQKAFEDSRYVRVDGKPMFVIFAPHDMPSTAAFCDHWRDLARKAGYPGLYLVAISNIYSEGIDPYHNPILEPFDAMTQLVPQDYLGTIALTTKRRDLRRRWKELNFGRRLNDLKPKFWRRPTRFRTRMSWRTRWRLCRKGKSGFYPAYFLVGITRRALRTGAWSSRMRLRNCFELYSRRRCVMSRSTHWSTVLCS